MHTVSAKLPDTPQLQNPCNTGPNWLEPLNTLQVFMLILTLLNCFLSWNTKNFRKKNLQEKKIKLHHEIVLLNIFSLKLNLCVWSLFILQTTFLLEHLKSPFIFTPKAKMSENVERQHYSTVMMFFVTKQKIINSHLSKYI